MRTGVPEKLLKVLDDITAKGSVPLTRLTVLKKWFQRPPRLAAFALWVAQRAISHKGKISGVGAKLFRDAKGLLSELDDLNPVLSAEQRKSGRELFDRLRAFQNVYRESRWGRIRSIENWNLFLVERSLAVLLVMGYQAPDGYRLAAEYCQHYDPKYGNGLNGPSAQKLMEIVRWMFRVKALEDEVAKVQESA